jgi:PAS domain S-box-containing protein
MAREPERREQGGERRREHRFRALLEATPDPIIIVDGEGKISLVNGQTERMFGYTRDELVGKPVEVLVPERFRRHVEHRDKYMKAPSVRPMGADFELFARRKDGTEIPVEISLSPMESDDERLVLAALRDVSARRSTEAQLRQRETRFRVLLEATPDPIVIVDGEGTIALVNGQTETMFGYQRDELIGQPIEILVPARFTKHVGHRNRYMHAPTVRPMGAGLELYAQHRDGTEIPVEISLSPLETEGERLVLAALRDVAARRAADQQLRASERRVRSILTSAYDAFISMNADGTVTEWNPAAEQLFGWTKEEAIGRPVADLVIPESVRDQHWRGLRRFLETGHGPILGRPIEVDAIDRHGARKPVELTITPMLTGEEWSFHAFARDISGRRARDRRRAAQQAVAESLAESAAAEEAIAAILPTLCATLDWDLAEFWVPNRADGRFRRRAAWAVAGLQDCEFLTVGADLVLDGGTGLIGRLSDATHVAWVDDFATESDLLRRDEAARAGIHSAAAVPLNRGREVVGVIALLSTEFREREPELDEVLTAIGRQAGEYIGRRLAEEEAERVKDEFFSLISHELRTPLTSIIGYTELLIEVEGDDMSEQARRFVEVIERNARRELRLVIDLLLLTRIEAGTFRIDPANADLRGVISEAAEVARPLAEKSGIELSIEMADVPTARGDVERLGQVIDNLLSNAIKFTPEGGSVAVRLRAEPGWAVIEVADTGMGVPEHAVEHLFDRMFRTEQAERLQIQGTGLGLTIVRAIVDAHEGTIHVESEVDKGTTITVRLPLSPAFSGNGAPGPEREEVAP